MRIPSNCVRVLYLKFFGAKIGKDVFVARKIDVKSAWNIVIGDNSIINRNSLLDGRGGLSIGQNVDVAQDTFIWTAQHDYNDDYHRYISSPVVIDDYVWLCSRVTILPGCNIGRGSVIASGAVVSKNVEPMMVVGGIPAKIIAERKSKLLYSLSRDSRNNQ